MHNVTEAMKELITPTTQAQTSVLCSRPGGFQQVPQSSLVETSRSGRQDGGKDNRSPPHPQAWWVRNNFRLDSCTHGPTRLHLCKKKPSDAHLETWNLKGDVNTRIVHSEEPRRENQGIVAILECLCRRSLEVASGVQEGDGWELHEMLHPYNEHSECLSEWLVFVWDKEYGGTRTWATSWFSPWKGEYWRNKPILLQVTSLFFLEDVKNVVQSQWRRKQ